MIAPLWVAFQANLGTLLRTCEHGDTLESPALTWRHAALYYRRGQSPATAAQVTIVLLGHEWHGVPDEQAEAADVCVEIPIVGQGASLNVALADSLVLYRLAGLS